MGANLDNERYRARKDHHAPRAWSPSYTQKTPRRKHTNTPRSSFGLSSDSGCLCFATISLSLARRLRPPRIPITPRDLDQVNVLVNEAITHVAYTDTDIDGHKKKRVFFYVIPDQGDDVIISRPWMDADEMELAPTRGELYIGTTGLVVKERRHTKEIDFPVKGQTAGIFNVLVKRIRSNHSGQKGPAQVFTASLADIEKALAPKRHSDPR